MLKVILRSLVGLWLVGCGLVPSGCAHDRYYNTVGWIEGPGKAYNTPWLDRFMKTNYYYPVRDAFDPHVWASLVDPNEPPGWNTDGSGNVPDGSFYVNRRIEQISPAEAAAGPSTAPAPRPPWTVVKARPGKKPVSFIGEDGLGRRFMVKLDDPAYPEAGSAAAFITTRVFWLLGYHVPANYIVTITGTGNPEYDGRRAEASLFVEGKVLGHFKFDLLRHRREMRGLRLVSAWVDDVDRGENNTLVVFREGKSYYYLLDFDSTMGLWKRRPKMTWLGHRHVWDPPYAVVDVFTLGALSRSQIRHHQPFSKAVGIFFADDFDPMTWKSENPNTPFRLMSKADACWMARKIAKISPEQLLEIVKAAKYSRREDQEHVFRTLQERQEKIAKLPERWEQVLSTAHK